VNRRLEGLIAPLVLLVAIAAVVGLTALSRQDSDSPDQASEPVTEPTDSAAPSPSVTPTGPEDRGRKDPRRRGGDVPRLRDDPDLPAVTCENPTRTQPLTVVSYNIKSAKLSNGFDLGLIADQLATWQADVVLLQEVDRFRVRSRRQDQPALLADRLGMEWAFGANVRLGSTQYGTAILSRFPILAEKNVPLPNRAGGQQRGLLWTELDVEGRPVSVYTTHFQHKKSYADIRREQGIAVENILRDDPNPSILGGDLNSVPSSPPVGILTSGRMLDSWSTASGGQGATAPAGNPRARIDYLLHSDELTVTDTAVMPTNLSDHRAVRATYELEVDDECFGPGSVQ
jgi:endonuclease/exonuclease/phosphatase family metal-dependent hydrolase